MSINFADLFTPGWYEREFADLIEEDRLRQARTIIAGGRIRGDTFALDDARRTTDVVWGAGSKVIWAAGESLMLFAPQGTCKTTLAQQLVLRRIGAREDPLLGFPVRADHRPVLYLASQSPNPSCD